MTVVYRMLTKIPLRTALYRFYSSDTYKRLAEETTKLWHLGPVALYAEFSDELKRKHEIRMIPK